MNIKVYTADVDRLMDAELFARLYRSVSSERRAKVDRMIFAKDKRLSLGAGALLEAALAAEGVDEFAFTTKANLKPCLAGGGIFFNLSHSGARVMCAVSDHEIGCDVEKVTDTDMEIARRFFYAEEYASLKRCEDGASLNDLFFRYWTLKESFMKATGQGFSLPLDEFCIVLNGDRVTVRQNVDERAYYFKEFCLNDGYKYAICSVDKPADGAELKTACELRL